MRFTLFELEGGKRIQRAGARHLSLRLGTGERPMRDAPCPQLLVVLMCV